MLLSLSINNYAIIDSIGLDFDNGLNVLTGETGAGKSIIIGALSLALGSRGNIDAIRTDAEKASVQALFSFSSDNEELTAVLSENCIDANDGTLLLRRELFANGRNVCRINDTLVTVAVLKSVALYLVDIHGQHEHQRLLSPETHLQFLDSFAADEISSCRETVALRYREMKEAYSLMAALAKELSQSETLREKNENTSREIKSAAPSPGEDDKNEARFRLLQNSEKIFENIRKIYNNLYASDNNVILKLKNSLAEMENVLNFDETLRDVYKEMSDCCISLEEAVISVRDFKEKIEFEPQELDDIQARLALINKLKRKYGATIEEITAAGRAADEWLAHSSDLDEKLSTAKAGYEQARAAFIEQAGILTAKRKKAAENLSRRLCGELSELAMPNTTFEVQFRELPESRYSENGTDSIEFLISTNAGQELKPLAKIASGGEISRIMLAIKSIFADSDSTETLIFDEIDTGISGRTAQIVAEKMYALSRDHQVLAITHLTQLASMADTHYLIGKHVSGGNTYTDFIKMDTEGRENELARMIGGVEVSSSARIHAAEMLKQAAEYKQS